MKMFPSRLLIVVALALPSAAAAQRSDPVYVEDRLNQLQQAITLLTGQVEQLQYRNQQLQQQMEKIQAEVAQKKVEATAGGGMVTVEANGKQEIVTIKISPEVVSQDDVQMLEDLVLAACNEALRKSRELVQQEMGKITGGLKIPRLVM